jgi:hypothetical protein
MRNGIYGVFLQRDIGNETKDTPTGKIIQLIKSGRMNRITFTKFVNGSYELRFATIEDVYYCFTCPSDDVKDRHACYQKIIDSLFPDDYDDIFPAPSSSSDPTPETPSASSSSELVRLELDTADLPRIFLNLNKYQEGVFILGKTIFGEVICLQDPETKVFSLKGKGALEMHPLFGLNDLERGYFQFGQCHKPDQRYIIAVKTITPELVKFYHNLTAWIRS